MFSLEQMDLTRIHASFPEIILRRGWNYYLDRLVTQLTIEESSIRATVKGATPYQVQIDLGIFRASSCTCPYDDYCKHMAAVLFAALDEVGRPPTDLLRLRTQKQPVLLPKETDSVEDWQRYFATTIQKPTYTSAYILESFFLNGKATLLPLSRGWEPVKQSLFRLHAWLFLCKSVEEIYEGRKRGPYSENLSLHRTESMRWMPELHRIVENLHQLQKHLQNHYETHLLSTRDFLAQNAFPEHETITDWSAVYGTIWAELLSYEPWILTELHRLGAELGQERATSPYMTPREHALTQAMLHLEIILGDDVQAMEFANVEVPSLEASWIFPYLRSFVVTEQWGRLIAWLQWAQPRMRDATGIELANYLSYWRELYKFRQITDVEWEQTLFGLLPHSFMEYASTLLIQERYQEWVDLHLFYEVAPSHLRSDEVKQVEAENLTYLFPLYHQAAERFILEKNRPSYKQSVRLLKKLKTRYKKLKQVPRWDAYIETLSAKYKRYRAFQEELRKGKLIP